MLQLLLEHTGFGQRVHAGPGVGLVKSPLGFLLPGGRSFCDEQIRPVFALPASDPYMRRGRREAQRAAYALRFLSENRGGCPACRDTLSRLLRETGHTPIKALRT